MLEEAKSQCDWLVVGLQSDPSADRKEKNKPVQDLKEREIQLSAIKFVDEIIIYNTEKDLMNLLQKLRPDVRIIGADHREKKFTGWQLPFELYFNSRDHSYSTSELRKRVIKSSGK